MSRRRLAFSAILTCLLILAAGCGTESARNSGAVATSTVRTQVTTPRGLAARLLTHIEPRQVTWLAGSGDLTARTVHGMPDAIAVMLNTADPRLTSVRLNLQAAEPALGPMRCGRESGYTSVTCHLQPQYREGLVRRGEDARLPVLEGRFRSEARGLLLVQIWGQDSSGSRRLIGDILSDPLLGTRTTKALNDQGERLTDFKKLVTKVELKAG